jgi:SH3-like domain-containing protein
LTRSYAFRKTGILTAVTCVVVLVALIGTLVVRMSDARRTDEAIVTVAFTPVKNSPDTKSSDAFVLHAGVKVWMTDRVTEWIKIRLADGKVGWVEQNAVEVI